MLMRHKARVLLCIPPLLLAAGFILLFWNDCRAETRALSSGQSVYVPAYSHIYQGSLNRPFYLTVLLSIRNVSPVHPVTITQVAYYDDGGELVRTVPDAPFQIPPLATYEYLVSETDDAAGSGANFMVAWESETRMVPPLLETVMISTRSSQGISFRCPGVVVEER